MTVSATAGTPVGVRPRTGGRGGRRVLTVLACTAMVLGLVATPSGAITGGQLDEGRHPYVGGTVLYYAPLDETIVNCTGSLISATVFLTAAHCGRHDTARSVSFDEVFDPRLLSGTMAGSTPIPRTTPLSRITTTSP